ncbi:hypothetical protein [uncultured Proteiniphilum sp.]|uniref:hypothetical protein n=1 Tax=uncultured Proteiniphilum sp. TaxID=497637 RepID=UPI002609FAAD|nr:hypothetical protein [uncultured Proteiniphilum sp.]
MAIFDFKDITTFKVMVMSADPKPEGKESGADGITYNRHERVGDVSEKCRRRK